MLKTFINIYLNFIVSNFIGGVVQRDFSHIQKSFYLQNVCYYCSSLFRFSGSVIRHSYSCGTRACALLSVNCCPFQFMLIVFYFYFLFMFS